MGQYFYICNLDKQQYLHPHKFGDGLKLGEIACSQNGAMSALAFLLADTREEAVDFPEPEVALLGSWSGDRIVIPGDYGEEGKWLAPQWEEGKTDPETGEPYNLYSFASDHFEDISDRVIRAVAARYPWHPLGKVNTDQSGWRDRPEPKPYERI